MISSMMTDVVNKPCGRYKSQNHLAATDKVSHKLHWDGFVNGTRNHPEQKRNLNPDFAAVRYPHYGKDSPSLYRRKNKRHRTMQ